jgi:hypothetical protein
MDLSTTPLAPLVTIILIVCVIMMAVVFSAGRNSSPGATSVAKIKARW